MRNVTTLGSAGHVNESARFWTSGVRYAAQEEG